MAAQHLVIIGNCPLCNSPIYAPEKIAPRDTPIVKRTCSCYTPAEPALTYTNKDIKDSMHTK